MGAVLVQLLELLEDCHMQLLCIYKHNGPVGYMYSYRIFWFLITKSFGFNIYLYCFLSLECKKNTQTRTSNLSQLNNLLLYISVNDVHQFMTVMTQIIISLVMVFTLVPKTQAQPGIQLVGNLLVTIHSDYLLLDITIITTQLCSMITSDLGETISGMAVHQYMQTRQVRSVCQQGG